MDKPAYAGVESIVKREDAFESAFGNLKRELIEAHNQRISIIETKLKSALAENERLHHERIILARELHRRRANDAKIIELAGGHLGPKG